MTAINTRLIISFPPQTGSCSTKKQVLRIDPQRSDALAASNYIYNKSEDRHLYENAERKLKRCSIEIKPYSPPSSLVQMACPQKLLDDLGLNEKTLNQFLLQSLSLITNPVGFSRYLKPIEEALTAELQKKGIAFHDKDAPEYLVTGRGYYLPGPPPADYESKKKGRILDSVLLAREQSQGINQEGTPTFIGGIDRAVSDPFVKSGHIFKENDQISTLLIHGKNSHRLFFQALVESLKGGAFSHITPRQLLSLLMEVEITSDKSRSLWDYLLDINADIVDPLITPRQTTHSIFTRCFPLSRNAISPLSEPNFLNDQTYHFSCRSPYVFNSLLTCFGKELGLPNLMHCLLDSHWKSVSKMVKRLDASDRDNTSYLIVMEGLALNPEGLGDIGKRFPFTLSEEIASIDRKYRKYPNTPYNATEIKLKLKQGESLSPEELKEDKVELMAYRANFDELMKESENHELMIDFIKKKPTAERIQMIIYLCLRRFPGNNASKASLDSILFKVLDLSETKALSFNDKMRIYNYLEFVSHPYAKTYFAVERLNDQESENERK